MTADHEERKRDEDQLAVLNCWDAGWTCNEIAATFPRFTRNAVIGFVQRVHHADPDALTRKPAQQKVSQ